MKPSPIPIATRTAAALVVMVTSCALWPHAAHAQGAITGGLPEVPPVNVAFRLGPLDFWPILNVKDLGVDTNVFDEAVDPKEDWAVTFSPDLVLWADTGYLQFSGRSSADFVYYQKYKSERSISRQLRGRLMGRFSLLRPWVAAGLVETAARPTPEIDLRAKRRETELSAGLGFELSPISRVYGAVTRQEFRFDEGEVFRGVDLRDALDRVNEMISGGVRMRLTPFTTMSVKAQIERNLFDRAPIRNDESRSALVDLEFGSDAVITGRTSVGFQDFRPDDPETPGYRGLVASAGLTARFRMARFGIEIDRRVQYSFETDQNYYLQSGGEVSYTQRLIGPWDVQGRVGLVGLGYTSRESGQADRTDTLRTYGAGVGYNLRDRSRIAVNFEHVVRLSARPDGDFRRRRIYGSFTQNF